MANSSITSRSASSVAGTCGAAGTGLVTITSQENKHKTLGGITMYVKLTVGASTALNITPKVINSHVNTSDAYGLIDGDNGTFGAASVLRLAASGNYRIKLPVTPREQVVVEAQFDAGTNGVAIIDFSEEGEN